MTLEALVAKIERLQRGHTDRKDEAEIIELLSGLSDADLDEALSVLDVNRLLSDVDDRIVGPKNRTALLELVVHDRIEALSMQSRIRLVKALQRGHTDAADERAIRRIFIATKGWDLLTLRDALDTGDDHRDLQQLVYRDIDNPKHRHDILAHIKKEGGAYYHGVKVLSDIDDTFICNWKDERYPKGTVYPGVRQLYMELGNDVTFVTARPSDRPGFVEKATRDMLTKHGMGDATVLTGCFTKLLTNASIAEKKLTNFVEYAQLYPEVRFVFVGDNGQGDAMFGKRMLERAPERMEAVLIHHIGGTRLKHPGIKYFKTYVGAAHHMKKIGLLVDEAFERVIEATDLELRLMEMPEDLREQRLEDLERDISNAGL